MNVVQSLMIKQFSGSITEYFKEICISTKLYLYILYEKLFRQFEHYEGKLNAFSIADDLAFIYFRK